MTNSNCLEGIKCPGCGNEDSFRIAVKTVATFSDNGMEEHGDLHWDEHSFIECTNCDRHGTVSDFDANRVRARPAAMPASQAKPVYDNYEISGCWRVGDGANQAVETCGDADAQFWTLYGHIDGQGVEAIGDFVSREAAEAVYQRITGQAFTGGYQADDRLRLMHAAPTLHESLEGMLAERREIAVIWAIEDVREVRPDLGDEQAWEVLQAVRRGHDANYGICWETLAAAADSLFPQPEAVVAPIEGPTDQVAAMMAYEAGELGEEATLALFQNLVDSGLAWKLQGHYGRVARDLLNAGLIEPATDKPRYPSPAEILADPKPYLPEQNTGNGHDPNPGNER